MRIWTTSRDELKHVRTVMMCAVYFGGRRAKMELKSGDVAVGVIVSTNFGQRSRPPDGEGEVYEIKADGYRPQLHLRPDETKAYSRPGLDWTEEFSPIAAAADGLIVKSAVIDGDAVVYGSNGCSDFQRLRRELGKRNSDGLQYHAFDLLYLDRYDLRPAPLSRTGKLFFKKY